MTEAISIRKLNYSYPDGKKVLKDICLTVNEGEKIALIGPNGAGKTTLLLHLNGLLARSKCINIMRENLADGDIYNIRKNIGLVFEDPDDQLFSPTVYDDVAFGPRNLNLPQETIDRRVKSSLKKVGALNLKDRIPGHLSYGEKKRVSIATALALAPKILAFDEPTNNLDPRGRKRLINLLDDIETTTVIVTHDLEAVLKLTDRTILLNEGRIVESGSTQEILSDRDLMENNGLEVPLSIRLK